MSKRSIKRPYSISRATSIDTNCCRSPTASVFSNKADKSLQSVMINKSKFLKATRHAGIKNIEIPRPMVVEALGRRSRRASQHPVVQNPVCIPENTPRMFPVRPSLLALVGRKQTVVRDYFFPQKSLDSSIRFSRTGIYFSPGLSTIELRSTLAKYGTYSLDRALSGSP